MIIHGDAVMWCVTRPPSIRGPPASGRAVSGLDGVHDEGAERGPTVSGAEDLGLERE